MVVWTESPGCKPIRWIKPAPSEIDINSCIAMAFRLENRLISSTIVLMSYWIPVPFLTTTTEYAKASTLLPPWRINWLLIQNTLQFKSNPWSICTIHQLDQSFLLVECICPIISIDWLICAFVFCGHQRIG